MASKIALDSARRGRRKSGRRRSALPGRAAGKARKRACHGCRARHGRGGARRVRPRSAHAADRHSCHQRSARDLRPRRARAALGRYHQGRRRASGEPRHAVRRCRAKPRHRAGVRQDFFDLRALARSAGDSLAGRAAAKGLQSEVDISEKLPALVVGDPVRLRAALENLIDNAVKFTERGGVALAVTPARAAKGKVGVAFAVSDSGIGLTLNEIKRLFRPFSQANVSIASRFGGAGLGLSSVKQLARAMGGDIVVAPRRGRRHHLHADGDADPRQGAEGGQLGRRCRCRRRSGAPLAHSQRRGQSVRPRRAQCDPDRTRPSGGIHRPRRGRRRADRARRVRRGADGHGVAGHQRHRGDQANSRAEARRSAASRSSGCRAAATTRRHRAPPAPTPSWSSL